MGDRLYPLGFGGLDFQGRSHPCQPSAGPPELRPLPSHLVRDQHVDPSTALSVDLTDFFGGDSVQVGDLLLQLLGGQVLQVDGMVHCRNELVRG